MVRALVLGLLVTLATALFPATASAVTAPETPYRVSTYPVADGVGLEWQGEAGVFHVEHRFSPTGAWSEIAQVSTSNETKFTVDHDVQPGQYVELRVYGETAGMDGTAATVTATRPDKVPTVQPSSAMAVGGSDSAVSPLVFRTSDPNTTVQGHSAELPSVEADASSSMKQAVFYVGTVPGPGTYAAGPDTAFGYGFGSLSAANCTISDARLVVRRVLFADDLTPLVFDGSWRGVCADGGEARVEIRLGSGEDLAVPTNDPATAGPMTTWADTPKAKPVTITNTGPGIVHLGQATLVTGSTTDWSADDGCSNLDLPAGASCTVATSFATTAAGVRDTRLEFPMSDSAGALAPYTVSLFGCGATVPAAPTMLSTGGLLTGAQLEWSAPPKVCDLPITRYDVRRRASGSSGGWTSLPPVTNTISGRTYDPTLPDDGDYDYEVRAVNAVGHGAWSSARSTSLNTEGAVLTQQANGTGPHHLVLATGFQSWIPPQTSAVGVDYDWADPAFSPAGTKLVVSRSTNPGDGSDGEYDLYLTTVADLFGRGSAAPVQLTSQPGAETQPAFSPDATEIAFTYIAPDGTRSLEIVPTTGGAPKTVGAFTNAVWDPTASHTLIAEGASNEPLHRITLGGDAVAIDGTQGAHDPAVSPDGTVAFIDATGALATLAPTVAPGTAATEVLPPPASGHVLVDPAYTPSGRLLVLDRYGYSVLVDTSTGFRDPEGGLEAFAPGIRDVYAPTVHVDRASGGIIAGRQTVWFSYRDGTPYFDETPHVAVRVSCRLDKAAYAPCASPTTYTQLADGHHRIRVRAVDETGKSNVAILGFTSDQTPPMVTFTRPGRSTSSGGARFTWQGTDPTTQVVGYQVRWRRAQPGEPWPSWRPWRTTTSNRLRVFLDPGDEACAQVRATNAAGITSRSYTRCTARPYDDAALASRGHWQLVTDRAALDQTLTVSTTAGDRLTTPSPVSARRVGVLAQTCSTCGAVKVYLGAHYLGTAQLHSRRTRSRVWVWLPRLDQALRGRVRLVTTSRAPVRIDAVFAARS